ncbi:uncharacterized protein LOC110457720 isoform X2 [Mizuhopecten yessoensis]|uniref:uncharacterized protein LOC110457720 isoform X2 n=1 Tax=Mizuhopecten yessoensis TaxID=6573 RepID=UPI000B4571B8|nr:uncharacterized protein LOC110457720 isoform X2 [Mizuhopecten yessoensis]
MDVGRASTGTRSNNKKVAPELGRLFATYQLIPSFKLSEKHHCYVDSLHGVDELPEPRPPSVLKDVIFDPKQYSAVDMRAVQAPAKLLKQPLSTLVEYLTEGYQDDMSKMRAIYRWVTAQPVDQLSIEKKEPPHSHTQFQLWRIKHRKGNYAQLVSLLCRFAQIPCVIIHGKLKGSTYEVGERMDDEQHYGEWNAVLVNGDWRFINAYWGTCAEGGVEDTKWEVVERGGGEDVKGEQISKQLFYSCDENYFLTDPDQMASTHLPSDPIWQLKNKPVSEENFEERAFLKDRFYNLKLKLISPQQCVVHATGEVEIKFELPKDKCMDMDFQYLMFRLKRTSSQGSLHRYDRYVFLHRLNETILVIRIRSPVVDTFRFELVGKDVTVDDPAYDYDWLTIFKIIFTTEKENCEPFPECPVIGWGPGRDTIECGLAPMSHFAGEIEAKDTGALEVKFSPVDGKDWSAKSVRAELVKGGNTAEDLSDHVVQRYENGDIIFNVNTPRQGEYALKLYTKENGEEVDQNFCNYLVTSRQIGENFAFPRGFNEKLGPKKGAMTAGITAISHPSGFIQTEDEEIVLEFQNDNNIDLSLNLSGKMVRPEVAKRLITQEQDGNICRFTVRFPQNGNYGLRLKGNTGKGFEDMYDYVVKYKKNRTKRTQVVPAAQAQIGSQTATSARPSDQPPAGGVREKSLGSHLPNQLRERIRNAIYEENDKDLESAVEELKALGLPTTKNDIDIAEKELDVFRCRRELVEATTEKDMHIIREVLKKVREKQLEVRLEREVVNARSMLERIRNINKLLHAVLTLDQKTIAEIRCYNNPPPAVHRVMMATLLLLGHWEEETEEWKNVQITLGKLGKEAIKRRIQELNVDSIALDVALGARDLIRDFSLDQVRMVSAGGATFYVWVKGLTEELEKRNAEVIDSVRPRTSNRRKRERTMFPVD